MIKHRLLAFTSAIAIVVIISCKVQITPLYTSSESGKGAETEAPGKKSSGEPRLVYRFFDEDFVSGGFSYVYPDESKVFIPEESGKNGEVALQFELVADDYSGGSICLYNLLYDVTPYIVTGALEFWIKGDQGGEVAWIALVDDETGDGCKTAVRLPLNDYGGITDEWKKISIPLSDFGNRGVYWDAKKRVEVPKKFDWDKVVEFRIEIKKGDNKAFKVWADDLFIYSDVYEPKAVAAGRDEEYWDAREETLDAISTEEEPDVKVIHEIFTNDIPAGGFAYVYGGKTAHKVQPSEGKSAEVLAMYMDGSDYSGVTLALGNGRNINLEKLVTTHAGLAFWAKAGAGVSKVYVGLLDDESDGAKVHSKVALGDFGKLTAEWRYFMIPLKKFSSKGKYWDANKKAEVLADVKWNMINEFRISINKGENRVAENQPVAVYVDNVSIIADIPGWVDPEEYWSAFQSDAPDVLLHDFETEKDCKFEPNHGEKSEIAVSYAANKNVKKYGNKSLQITYKLIDYADAVYSYVQNSSPMEKRDWSKHWAIRFSLYSEKSYQAINVQVGDAGNEVFIANVGSQKGWNEILLPMKNFRKFEYYQPADAEENGTFDLNAIRFIDFKPSGEGTAGTFRIDNVTLTNVREVEKPKAPEELNVKITGDFSKTVTDKIYDGIFGINVALWDGDLLLPKTVKYVKAINHSVLRYPGGLRADDDHWREVLDKKDWMADTEEFLEFCEKTDTEGMITVNFGKGTPKEAAAWVKYVNSDGDRKVRYWEIGNELYGDWHANHCSAEEYGKRSVEFIKAMKAVDPDILVAVVWVLEGPWNEEVFKYTKDIADAVVVHHYPQHSGQENDMALLSAPQSLERILGEVRSQVDKYGTKGKKYEIWLTEWNSVDFQPGPQTLSVVNGLFVIDYLGMLAKINIEQASYWDVHNDMTPQGGDYGYLSRTGAPDGDNVPRSSYYGFKLANESLRGTMVKVASSSENITAYLTKAENGIKVLTLVNKMAKTKAVCNINIPGFKGKATVKEYTKENMVKGLDSKDIVLKGNDTIILKPYSAVALFLKKDQ